MAQYPWQSFTSFVWVQMRTDSSVLTCSMIRMSPRMQERPSPGLPLRNEGHFFCHQEFLVWVPGLLQGLQLSDALQDLPLSRKILLFFFFAAWRQILRKTKGFKYLNTDASFPLTSQTLTVSNIIIIIFNYGRKRTYHQQQQKSSNNNKQPLRTRA